jgi:hypothetical protein
MSRPSYKQTVEKAVEEGTITWKALVQLVKIIAEANNR